MDTTELEAATFRRLIAHLQSRHDLDEAELLRVAGFNRATLAQWYQQASILLATPVSSSEARAAIVGSEAPPHAPLLGEVRAV
ncbi:MAG: hypothetical protein KatS3mg126_2242 [Lysobacteraceae bacterium]|nr:MAG: hypothetical protein KatS3mg126_2242 [Xanthomonadaceae bacterium]